MFVSSLEKVLTPACNSISHLHSNLRIVPPLLAVPGLVCEGSYHCYNIDYLVSEPPGEREREREKDEYNNQ